MSPTHYRGVGDGYSLGNWYPLNWTGRTKTVTGGPYPGKWYEHQRTLFGVNVGRVWKHASICKEFETEKVEFTHAGSS